ncbi:winged helix-turn-helix domain-containing protein [Methanolobus mangrovi]|uniref:Winged helix-turn-helix domain-containing protein n=1 Tax=Methanolobus mangrovi TaxID=3072977 RepID=A0AA51UGR0_9EURY|nr:winged helix-turn-helix domain-containing protein [Methanolobus mangrovi]WMW22962.1 winged helix-turn-helix domain-containing protein [Methanolobus mangrovi]
MKKTLLDVVFRSDKRKNVLLLLQNEPQEMEILLNSLGTTRQALLPQMRILEDHYLVSHYDDAYELTTIGKLVVNEMVPLLGTTDVFDEGIDYWGTRNLDFIPPYLLEKIGELKDCEIIHPPLTELYSIHKSLNPEYKVSSTVYVITTILYPGFNSIFTEMLESNVTIYYIVSQELLNKIRTEYRTEFVHFIKNKSFKMYVYNKKMKFLYFTFDSVHSLISMLKSNGEFDNRFVLCKGQSAVDWTKELFEYYLEDCVPVTELD